MNLDEKPDEKDCCGTGCIPCILDVYENCHKLKHISLDDENNSKAALKNVISPIHYSKFSVAYIERIYDYILLTFNFISENTNNSEEHVLKYNSGQYFIIKALCSDDNSTYFSRSYTPIKFSKPIFLQTKNNMNLENLGVYFQIVVKIYSSGLMSNYLKSLKIGDETTWRGPYGNFKYECNKYKYVLMICQGTAIAPMLSIVDEILSNENDETQIMLYYCCKSLNDVVFREELYKYRLYWNFHYEIFLSSYLNNENFDTILKYKESINNKKLSSIDVEKYIVNKDNMQVLIAGSENFMVDFDKIVQNCDIRNIILFR